MFEDANMTSDHVGNFTVNDLAELVAEAVELDKISKSDLPNLVERIVEKSSEIIAAAVLTRLQDGLVFQLTAQGSAVAPQQISPIVQASPIPVPQALPATEAPEPTVAADTKAEVVSEPIQEAPAPIEEIAVAAKTLREME